MTSFPPTVLVAAILVGSASHGCGQTPAAPAGQAAPAATGAVRAEPATIDFGFVKPEETVTAVVKLINPSDRPVTVVKAAPSCQCTGVDIEGKTIPAKGSIEMPISMKMSKAPVRKGASVTLVLQPINQVLKVEMSAEVTLPIRATPNFVDAQKGALAGNFTIAATDGKPFQVLSTHGKPPSFVDFDPRRDQPRSSYRLAYDFAGARSVPPYLVIETDRADCPLVDLRVRHETTHIRPQVKVAEFRSSFGRVAPGTMGEFDLEFEAVGAQRVSGVKSLWNGAEVILADQRADGANLLVTCVVRPAEGKEGLLFFPVEFTLGNVTYQHIVFGSVRPG